MEFLRDPQFDFLGKKAIFTLLSALLVVASLALLATRGLQYGIDFRGGADVVLRFVEEPGIEQIRGALAREGLGGAQIQKLTLADNPEANDVLIRVPPQDDGEEEGDVAGNVLAALRSGLPDRVPLEGKIDINLAGRSEIRRAILQAHPGRMEMAEADADTLTTYRDTHSGLFASVEEAGGVPGIAPETAAWLREYAAAGGFAIRSSDYVGPSVGRELKTRATYAVVGALIAMLIYIWFRFEKLAFGVAAIITLAHDAIIALGAVSLTGKEFDLTVLAAILTVVGYSINDTIVIFDRVRENIRHRRGGKLEGLFNDSINQTLSRTILTTLLVLIVVVTLWLFGGSRLNPFAFTLLVGAITGTYSTIAVSSPIVVWWRSTVERKS
jgi:preprotein translocase subunit SecF